MLRIPIKERPNWQESADRYGFKFHTMHGEKYWDESAYYQFSLKQIEEHIEAPTEEIHEMCLHVVDKVLANESLLKKFKIPETYWDFILESWRRKDQSLYSRFDFAYNGKDPAKFYENNADTPTSVYETGFWQWLWLQDQVDSGHLNKNSDQFNSLQEKLVNRFFELNAFADDVLHFACCKDTEEDRGTVKYLEDCAIAAKIPTEFVFIEDIGVDAKGHFSDLNDHVITWMFKLYPWEFMFDEEYGQFLTSSQVRWLEPPWKALLSNKALLPVLWQFFEGHPNLLPAFFEEDLSKAEKHCNSLVKKPIFSREGANISISSDQKTLLESDGPYGEEGFIYQQTHLLPKFANNYTLIGSWLVDNQAAGISIREDSGPITQDMSRYLPHIILD